MDGFNSDTDTEVNNLPVQKRPYKEWNNNNILKAVEDVKNKNKSLRACAKVYNIPVSTLHNKLSGKTVLDGVPGRKTVLSKAEEIELANWAIKMSRIGYGPSKFQILSKVEKLVSKEHRPNSFRNGVPGKIWWRGFLKRNPEVKLKTPEPLQIARAKSCTPTAITTWFNSYHKFLSELNMVQGCGNRIWNCDESGFPLCPRSGKVLASSAQKNVLQITGNTKSQITVLCAISASGNFIPPFQLYSATRLTFNPLENGVEGARFALSKSGWMNTEIFYGWLANHFIPSLSAERPVVLLLDGHTSHIDIEISRLCEQNQVELFCLPPHASHIVQPLDVSVFKAMKSNWKKNVHEYLTTNSGEIVDKKNFAAIFRKCFEDTMCPRIIINGFRSSGVYPCNRRAIDETKLKLATLFDVCLPEKEETEDVPNYALVSETRVDPAAESTSATDGEKPYKHLEKALRVLEISLGFDAIKEFKIMEEEGYDVADPVFDSWKVLRKNIVVLKTCNFKETLPSEPELNRTGLGQTNFQETREDTQRVHSDSPEMQLVNHDFQFDNSEIQFRNEAYLPLEKH